MTWARGSTRQYRKLRERTLANWPICYIAGPGCTIHATECDHVVPLSAGGDNSPDNLRGACRTCHRAKSQREAAAGRARRTSRQPERHPGATARATGG